MGVFIKGCGVDFLINNSPKKLKSASEKISKSSAKSKNLYQESILRLIKKACVETKRSEKKETEKIMIKSTPDPKIIIMEKFVAMIT